MLGTPLGHDDYVEDQLLRTYADHAILLDRISVLADLQSSWALLLQCAAARATYFLRIVRPESSHQFAVMRDEGLWRCVCRLLDRPVDSVAPDIQDVCTLPLVLGGLGFRSAVRTRAPAFWASWADAVHMIHKRHPAVADQIVSSISDP